MCWNIMNKQSRRVVSLSRGCWGQAREEGVIHTWGRVRQVCMGTRRANQTVKTRRLAIDNESVAVARASFNGWATTGTRRTCTRRTCTTAF